MAIAIKTTFLGPTNTLGSRVKATTMDALKEHRRTITLSWSHEMDGQGNHAAAAKALATKLGWDGEWHIADGGEFYIFTRAGSFSHRFTVEDAPRGWKSVEGGATNG